MSIQVSSQPRSTAAQERADYLTELLQLAQSAANQASQALWLKELRDHAATRIQEQTFPSLRDEAWRFTDLSSLLATHLTAAAPSTITADAISDFLIPEAPNRLVFVNGFYQADLSNTDLPAGITVGNLSALPESQQHELGKQIGRQPGAEEVFTALNTVGLSDAAIVFVSKNLTVETPLHLLFISTDDQPAFIQPRCLVVAEPNSALTVIEDHLSVGNGVYFTNSVSEIWLGENAQIKHIRVQRDSKTAFHVGKTAVSQARDSRYIGSVVSLGAGLSRHNLEVYQTGEQTETTLNSLTVLRGEQLGDTHSTIALTKPHGITRQLHKCIVDDRAHAVFNGRVIVPKAAQLTDAGQLNRNLLLSPKARVDTKPQLEIVADNVKCTHGATVGQLETDEIFYLQSRGIDADSARSLLVNAFAFEVLEHIPIDSLWQTLANQVVKR